ATGALTLHGLTGRRGEAFLGGGIWNRGTWSCIRPLRIIPLVPKPGTMPSSHNDLRGHCHGVTPFFLPTRSAGHPIALRHVASHLAQTKRDPHNRASHAHQAQAFSRAQSVRGPDAKASLRVV